MVLRIKSVVVLGILISSFPIAKGEEATNIFKPESEKLKLLDKLVEPWSKVDRWLIDYESFQPDDPTIRVHQTMAVASPGDLFKAKAHETPDYAWKTDPFAQEFFVHLDSTSINWPFKRVYHESTLKPGDEIPGSTWMDVLLRVLPRWPCSEFRVPVVSANGAPSILIEALRTNRCHLMAHGERIAEQDCAVFDFDGVKRTWIATNLGLCLMKEETYAPDSRQLIERIVTEKPEQVAPGLWLPKQYSLQRFGPIDSQGQPVLNLDYRVTLLRCLLNGDVPESTFIHVYRAGSASYTQKRNSQITQVLPGGYDLLDEVVVFAKKVVRLPTHSRYDHTSYLWLVVGLLVGMGTGFCLIKIVPTSPLTSTGKLRKPGGVYCEK